ncbi:vacuolar protein sorting-associated protein 51-like [Citrus sinensis]|nr:vacuolar protein sorting-associated protein 51-like [Citrus sinensis]
MSGDEVPLDEKARRMRDLLSSFYGPDPSMSPNPPSKFAPLDAINSNSFNADHYLNLLIHKSSLEGLLQRHVGMAAEIKNLDTDLQMLVYENYNKFISATDAIKRMNSNIMGMESNMEQLLEKFIYDLPARLGKCIKSEAYADAVRFYTGAMPIFKAYGDSSFQDCKRASEEAIAIIIKNLQVLTSFYCIYSDSGWLTLSPSQIKPRNIGWGKLFSDSESIQARAEAAMLLKQLDFPVDSLKEKLFEKLEQSLGDLQLKDEDISRCLLMSNDPSKLENHPESVAATVHEASVQEFVEAVRAYRVIFPDSDKQLIKLAQELVTKNFETGEQYGKKRIRAADLLAVLHALTKVYVGQKEGMEEFPLQVALGASKKAVLQGSMDILLCFYISAALKLGFCHLDFRQLLDDDLELLVKLRESILNWVQEGFQDFFRELHGRFLLLSGRNNSSGQVHGVVEGTQGDRILASLVLVLAQLSVFIEQTAIQRITEANKPPFIFMLEIAASFAGGGIRLYENGPAFVPGEICRSFRSAGEKLLHHYINLRNQRISVLLRKRFTTPNWVKHKEPREVHMFVDLLLQELEAIKKEVKQVLPQGLLRRHQRNDSNGSTNSSRSNPLREGKLSRTNTQKARSQLLETHLAKLFKQKVEIFTKVECTQESVITTIVKFSLKSLQEFVRHQTFNRSGFQQIQLDIQYLRTPLKEAAEDEAAIDFLLDEVSVAAAERCLDPIPLEQPILDKLIQAKLTKSLSQSAVSS